MHTGARKVDRNSKHLKVGIWLDYRGTSAGCDLASIGTDAVALAETLLQQQENGKVVVLTHRGNEDAFDALRTRYPERFTIDSPGQGAAARPRPHKLSRAFWVSKARKLLERKDAKRERIYVKRAVKRQRVVARRDRALQLLQTPGISHQLRGRFARFNVLLASLSVGASYRFQLLSLAIRAELARKIAKPGEDVSFPFTVEPTAQQRAATHQCDAWIIPHPLLNVSLPHRSLLLMPTGLVVNSTAEEHVINKRQQEAVQVLAWDGRGIQSANQGMLDASAVWPATLDLSDLNLASSRQLAGEELTQRRYVLVTTGDADSSSASAILAGFASLRDQHGVDDFDIVLAIKSDAKIDELERLSHEYDLCPRLNVIPLGSAIQLGALIRHSVAVICLGDVGNEAPVYQALYQHRAIITTVEIAAVSQLASMGDALPRFEIEQPDSVMAALLSLLNCPDSLANLQWSVSAAARQFAQDVNAQRILRACREAAVTPVTVRRPRKRVVLMQHMAYVGGVWQATRNLVQSLADINREKDELELVLAVLPEQTGCEEFQRLVPDVRIVRVNPVEVPRSTVERLAQMYKRPLPAMTHDHYLFFEGENGELLEADAWLAVIDRFTKCLAPLRPYSVLVHDMIQRGVPGQFDCMAWRAMVADGMRPSACEAEVVLTTTTATALEVMDEYQISASQMRVVPLAHDPVGRFQEIESTPVTNVRGPFVLNVANHASHKGAEVLLRAAGLWKQRSEWQDWMLVICGFGTRLFSPDSVEDYQGTHVPKMRQLVRDLGLVEGRDVVFLDYINDHQLKDLFERSSIVVNAARYDNGSYSMIEGTWFGKPVVSSRYPGAEYVDRRFGVDAHFFRVQDPSDLMCALDRARTSLTMPDAQRSARAQYAVREEVGLPRFGERLYDILSRLSRRDPVMPLFEELQMPTTKAA